MSPSASLLLLLLLGLSQALPLLEDRDKDGDRENKGDLDDEPDGDRKNKGDLDDEPDGDRENKGDQDDEQHGDRENKGDLDDETDGDKENKGDQDDEKDGDRENQGDQDDEKDGDRENKGDQDDDKDQDDEQDGDRENKGDQDDEQDGDREIKGDQDDEKDGDRENNGDQDDEKDGDRENNGDQDDEKDGDRENNGDQDDEKDGDRENKGDQDDEQDHDGVKDTEPHVDITTRILKANNGSSENLIEGDLVVPKHRNAIKCFYAQCLWRKGSDGLVRVPYVISRDFNSYQRQVIQGAANAFSRSTCIRYTPRTNERDYVYIVNKGGCYSSLGKTGGVQELSLNKAGCIYGGIAQHEMNHALGFQHEQVRSDRDSYVRINWQNITPGSAYNFYKADTNNLNTPYDYSSIMQYGRDAFSIAYGRDTITPIPNPNAPIGQRNGLSYWDIRRINLLYQC